MHGDCRSYWIRLDTLEKYNGQIDIAKIQVRLGPYTITFTEREKFLIQAYFKQIIYALVKNPEMEEDLISLQNIHPNILLNEAINK